MAAVVTRTLSSSSTTSTRAPPPARWPFDGARSSDLVRGVCGIGFGQRGRGDGENDLKSGAAPLLARHLDAPAVVADDVLRHPEAEARAFGARREERLEDARDVGLARAAREPEHLPDDVRDALCFLARDIKEALVLFELLPRRE